MTTSIALPYHHCTGALPRGDIGRAYIPNMCSTNSHNIPIDIITISQLGKKNPNIANNTKWLSPHKFLALSVFIKFSCTVWVKRLSVLSKILEAPIDAAIIIIPITTRMITAKIQSSLFLQMESPKQNSSLSISTEHFTPVLYYPHI